MSHPCEEFRRQLPRALVGDLAESERQALDKHLAECRGCRDENDRYRNTLLALHSMTDVSPPRHFFVYPQAAEHHPWHLFRRLSTVWQTAVAVAAALLTVFFLAALARLEVRIENGVLYAGFGGRIAAGKTAVPGDRPDTALLQALEERAHAADREWVRILREEMVRSIGAQSDEERRLLHGALLEMEKRVDARIALTARSIREESAAAQQRLYRVVSLDRQRDSAFLNERLDRLAASSELKAGETDTILETLLWLADVKLGNSPGGQR